MKRVAEGIYKRGKKYWVPVYDPATKKKRTVGTFATLTEAKEAKRRAEEQKRHGITTHTVARMAAQWQADNAGRWEATTAKHNADRVKWLILDFGGRKLDTINVAEALAWGASRPSCVPVARAMFNHAIRLDACSKNPFANLRLHQSRGRKDLVPISEEDLYGLADTALTVHGAYGPTFRAMILYLGYVGCRPAEMFGVEWGDIDYERLEVSICRQIRPDGVALPKNKRRRRVILPPPARDALMAMPRALDRPWVFTSKTGKMLSKGTFRYAWVPVAASQGNEGMDPYELRHFCGSHLADLGMTAQDIALQLGHTDGGKLAQRLYIHTYEDRARERLKRAYEANVTTLRSVAQGQSRSQDGSGDR